MFEYLLSGTGQQWTAAGSGALGAVNLGMAYALLEEVAINPTIELPELTQDWEAEIVGNSKRDVNTRPPDLPLEKPVCRSGSNS